MPRKTDPSVPRQGKQFSIWLSDMDIEILEWLMEHLGTPNRSEMMRTCLRSFAVQMKSIDKDRRGRSFDQ